MAERYKEWSSTFVRTRAEMFTCAVLLAALTFWPIDLTHLPLVGLGVEENKSIPKAQIMWPIILFYAFVTVSFIVRYVVETRHLINPNELIDDSLLKIDALLDDLRGLDLSDKLQLLDSQVRNLGVQGTLFGSDRTNEFNMLMQSTRDALQKQPRHPEPKELLTTVAQRLNQIGTIVLTDEDVTRIGSQVASQYREAVADSEKLRDEMAGQLLSLASGHTEYDRRAQDVITGLSALRDDISAVLDRRDGSFTAALQNTSGELAALRKTLSGFGSFEMFERNVIYFGGTLVISAAITIASVVASWQALLHPFTR